MGQSFLAPSIILSKINMIDDILLFFKLWLKLCNSAI